MQPPGQCRSLPFPDLPGLPARPRAPRAGEDRAGAAGAASVAECPPALRLYWLHGKKIGSRKGYVVFAASAGFIPPLGTPQTSQEDPGYSVGNSGAFPARRVWER